MKCPSCQMEFATVEALDTHREEMHKALANVEFTCTLCGYETDEAVDMETHKRSHPETRT